MKKYEMTSETKIVNGVTLYRIKALISFGDIHEGDIGGFIEKEENLSNEGNAWVFGDAWVCSNARVSGNAEVYGNAWVSGNAWVCGNARVFGNAEVCDNARISGNAEVYGNAWVFGDAWVCSNARVSGNAEVYGNAWVSGNAWVCGNARVFGNADYLCFKGLGSENRNTTFFKCKDGHIHVSCGCFSGNIEEFENKVKETHGDNKYAKEYLACIQVVKIHFEIDD